MWIRSQNKNALIEVNSLILEGEKIICNKWALGAYETKERAVEVLDKIQKHIDHHEYQLITGAFEGVAKVFQMPEK